MPNHNPVLFAATNSSDGAIGKTISRRNIATGVSVTRMMGQEGAVFALTFSRGVASIALPGVLVAVPRFPIPWIIPVLGG